MISVVIPIHNSLSTIQERLVPLLDCLDKEGVDDIVVIDNASNDQASYFIQTSYPSVKVYESDEFLSLASCYNLGARLATHSLLLFMNADIEIVSLDLVELVQCLISNPNGVILPQVHDASSTHTQFVEGSFSHGFFKFNERHESLLSSVSKTKERLASSVEVLAMTRDLFDSLDGFDVLYSPFDGECLDFCYRAWKQKRCCYDHSAFQCRPFSESLFRSSFSSDALTQIKLKNQYLFVWKNISTVSWLCEHVFILIMSLLSFQISRTRAFLKAFWMLIPTLISRSQSRSVCSDTHILRYFFSGDAHV